MVLVAVMDINELFNPLDYVGSAKMIWNHGTQKGCNCSIQIVI